MEGFTTNEVIECCAYYIKDGKMIDLPIPLHEGRLRGRGRMSQKSGRVLCILRKRWKKIGLPIPIHEGRLRGRGRMSQGSFVDRDYNTVSEVHFSVLQ
jgi:hypothetical protein